MEVASEIREINGGYQLILPTPFSVGPINVYVLKGDALTLVDTGPRIHETWEEFCRLLAVVHIKPADIEQVILTHHHPDHVGLLDYMQEDITIIGHWKNNPWIHKDQTFYEWHDSFYINHFMELGVPVSMNELAFKNMKRTYSFGCENKRITCEIVDGDFIQGLPNWTVLETPGHAGSHIALYNEKNGNLLAGDLIIENSSSNPFIEPPYEGESERCKSLLQYNDSLKSCLDLDISVVYSGHGNNIKDVHSLIQTRLTKQEERADKVLTFLKERPLTAFELSEKLYPALYKKQLGLTLSATVGQLDYLEENNAITINKSNDIWRFIAN